MKKLKKLVSEQKPSNSHWKFYYLFICLIGLFNLRVFLFGDYEYRWQNDHFCNILSYFDFGPPVLTTENSNKNTKQLNVVTYAITVTSFVSQNKKSVTMLDRCAILAQSIKIAMNSSRYDYHLYAFVHPEAKEVIST
jgi:hypothetical protein